MSFYRRGARRDATGGGRKLPLSSTRVTCDFYLPLMTIALHSLSPSLLISPLYFLAKRNWSIQDYNIDPREYLGIKRLRNFIKFPGNTSFSLIREISRSLSLIYIPEAAFARGCCELLAVKLSVKRETVKAKRVALRWRVKEEKREERGKRGI